VAELTLYKKQQMEAIKLLSDWSKWVVTIETAAIAGIFTWVTKPPLPKTVSWVWAIGPNAILILAAGCFVGSIYYAAQLLFSLPDIVEQLSKEKEISINDMKSDRMGAGILDYEKFQFILFGTGLGILIAGAVLTMVVANLYRA
jgi:hypothetical protein